MAPKFDPNAPLISADEAIRRAGGATNLAAAVSKLTPNNQLTVNAAMQWRHTNLGMVPPKHARAVAKILGVPRSSLEPDLWCPTDDAHIGMDRDIASAA